jgi:hypothetical protein
LEDELDSAVMPAAELTHSLNPFGNLIDADEGVENISGVPSLSPAAKMETRQMPCIEGQQANVHNAWEVERDGYKTIYVPKIKLTKHNLLVEGKLEYGMRFNTSRVEKETYFEIKSGNKRDNSEGEMTDGEVNKRILMEETPPTATEEAATFPKTPIDAADNTLTDTSDRVSASGEEKSMSISPNEVLETRAGSTEVAVKHMRTVDELRGLLWDPGGSSCGHTQAHRQSHSCIHTGAPILPCEGLPVELLAEFSLPQPSISLFMSHEPGFLH